MAAINGKHIGPVGYGMMNLTVIGPLNGGFVTSCVDAELLTPTISSGALTLSLILKHLQP